MLHLTTINGSAVTRNDIPGLARRLAVAKRYQGRGTRVDLKIVTKATLEEAERLRVAGGYDFFVIFDVPPADLTPAILAELAARYPKGILVDHHGLCYVARPAGLEDTTVSLMMFQLLDLESRLSKALRSGGRILAITNQLNYDPDGVLSWFILTDPVTALAHMPVLVGAAWVTDVSLFGGRLYGADPTGESLTEVEMFGLMLIDRQIQFDERLVDKVLSDRQRQPTRDEVRHVFVGERGEEAVYGCSTLEDVFRQMAADMPFILDSLTRYDLTPGIIRPWCTCLQRLLAVEKVIAAGMTTDGLVAFYSYAERPDFSFRTFQWLLVGAPAPEAHKGTPLMVVHSQRNGQTVASVPWYTQAADAKEWNLVPLIKALNAIEEEAGMPCRWFGRGAVCLRGNPQLQSAITPERLVAVIHEVYSAGHISKPRAA